MLTLNYELYGIATLFYLMQEQLSLAKMISLLI